MDCPMFSGRLVFASGSDPPSRWGLDEFADWFSRIGIGHWRTHWAKQKATPFEGGPCLALIRLHRQEIESPCLEIST